MRGAFGLVSLLVVAAIGCWLFVTYNKPVLDTGRKAHDEASQIAGRENDGTPIGQTYDTTPEDKGGHLNDLLVKRVDAGGAMEKHFGLKVGDQVITIGSINVRDNNDADLARAMMDEAYQRQQELVVLRNGQQITLPMQAGAPAVPATSPSAQTPAASASPAPTTQAAPPPHRGNIRDQLDLIRDHAEQQ
ncbi:MAG: hypothetical protein JWN24_4996 [Phycisphaerales bacterium]|nr:hypothetical protein [Phycisphaerales bacterium]